MIYHLKSNNSAIFLLYQIRRIKPLLNLININHFSYTLINFLLYDSVQLKTGCKYCLYNLAPRCGIRSAEISITSIIPDHGQTDTSSEISFITNLPLLQKFFVKESLNLIKGDTLLNTHPKIKLPQLKWYQQQTESLLVVDHETSMSLNKLSELAKREQILFFITNPLYLRAKLNPTLPVLSLKCCFQS